MALATSWLGVLALLSALCAASILVHHLVKKPALNVTTKLRLLFGLGVLPTIAAGASTVEGMEQTTHREFCGSCHVMGAHFENTKDPSAQSLAARHSRNPFFGDRSCYVCHADYGMYGYALTKAGGLRHVYLYYLGGYRQMPLAQAVKEIHLIKPYQNQNCRQCHTTTLQDWRRVPDHDSLKAELDSNKVSCASAGCHGYAHPFSKPDGSTPPAIPPSPAHSSSPSPASSPSSSPSSSPLPSHAPDAPRPLGSGRVP